MSLVGSQDYWLTGSRVYFQRDPVAGVVQPIIDWGTIEVVSPTVTPTLAFLSAVQEADPSAAQCLHALAAFDGAQLLTSRWNLGALYLLPELREARLATFWTERERLRLAYLDVSRTILGATGVASDAADLPFRLVESLVNMWTRDPQPDHATLAGHVADACLRVLGVTDDGLGGLRASTQHYLARYGEADGRKDVGVGVG